MCYKYFLPSVIYLLTVIIMYHVILNLKFLCNQIHENLPFGFWACVLCLERPYYPKLINTPSYVSYHCYIYEYICVNIELISILCMCVVDIQLCFLPNGELITPKFSWNNASCYW